MPRKPHLVERRIAEFVAWKGGLAITDFGRKYLAQKRQLRQEEARMPAWLKSTAHRKLSQLSTLVDLLKAKEKKYATALCMGKTQRATTLGKEIDGLKKSIARITGIN
ncbi:MAG: hypothetical protein NTW59_01935 [Candidatus Diapherotrites archaeon]|nr:hypothetical protein [Candidatus Diapherotrites archaeon]